MLKLSDYVAKFIAGTGVKHVFLLPGGGSMHLVDSVGKNKDINYICCLHEQACAFAAEAYAEYTNHLGVVLVTTGPGGTNAVTGLAAAWIESTACLFISGQTKRADLIGNRCVRSMGQQELDITSIIRPITKYAVTILVPESVRYHLEKAVYLATHGRRGPVWIDIPLDVQASVIDETHLASFQPSKTVAENDGQDLQKQVAETIALLNKAERPVLLAGNGIRSANAHKEFLELVDLLQAPVLTTWKAMDLIPESHKQYAGRPGAIGQRAANFTQQNSDCMLVIGARLDLPQTAFNHPNFARAAKKIMVDIDPAEIRKMQTPIHVPICADAKLFLQELLCQAVQLQHKNRSQWLNRCREWYESYPVVLPEYWNEGQDYVSTYVLMDVLSQELSASDLVVPGSSGPCSDIFMQAFKVKAGQRILNAPGLGAMGTGLPGSIGACLASGKKRTICVNGDGGFQLNIQELETVNRLGLPIKFFVLCNDGYASIMAMQNNYFQGRFVGSEQSSGLTFPNIIRIAKAYGLQTAEIKNHHKINRRVQEVLDHPGPVICAVKTSPEEKTAPRVTSVQRADGIIVSKPMEDMAPPLGREEFLSNMIIPPLAE